MVVVVEFPAVKQPDSKQRKHMEQVNLVEHVLSAL